MDQIAYLYVTGRLNRQAEYYLRSYSDLEAIEQLYRKWRRRRYVRTTLAFCAVAAWAVMAVTAAMGMSPLPGVIAFVLTFGAIAYPGLHWIEEDLGAYTGELMRCASEVADILRYPGADHVLKAPPNELHKVAKAELAYQASQLLLPVQGGERTGEEARQAFRAALLPCVAFGLARDAPEYYKHLAEEKYGERPASQFQ